MKESQLILSFTALMLVATYSFAAGSQVADLWYPGGSGSFWVYRLDNGREITLTVEQEYGRIAGDTYRIIHEDAPLWGQLVDRILTSDPLPETFGTKRPNPFLVFREKGSYVAGYGQDASKFIDDQLHKAFLAWGANINIVSLPKEWVILKDPSNIGLTWTVANLDTSMWFLGERTVEKSRVGGTAVGIEEVKTEAGQFTAFVVRYTYTTADSIDPIARVWITDKGPAKIKVDKKLTAELVRYEIKPFGPPPEPHAVTSHNRLTTVWGRLKKVP